MSLQTHERNILIFKIKITWEPNLNDCYMPQVGGIRLHIINKPPTMLTVFSNTGRIGY